MTQCTINAYHLEHGQAVLLGLALGNLWSLSSSFQLAGFSRSFSTKPEVSVHGVNVALYCGARKKNQNYIHIYFIISSKIFSKFCIIFPQILKHLSLISVVVYILKINKVYVLETC